MPDPAGRDVELVDVFVGADEEDVLAVVVEPEALRAVPAIGKGGHAVPLTLTTAGLFGSLLTIVSVAVADPRSVGWNRIGTAMESPPSTVRGKLTTWV